jgi:hypothetical protein
MADPWFKFFPTDWRSDPKLRMCSIAARGLWIEMIALMHEAIPYGHMVVSGISPTDTQLAVLTGAPSEQIPELIGELEQAGVFSRTKEGVIYSRKMTRVAKKAAVARKNGKNGGNPSLRKIKEISASVNQTSTNMVKPHMPEARNQREKEEPDGSSKKKPDENEKSPREWLATVLGAKHADAVLDHRRRLRKPLSPRAAELLAGKLARAQSESGLTPDQAADLMIERGWQGFEPQWAANASVSPVVTPISAPQHWTTFDDAKWLRILEYCRKTGMWASIRWGPAPGQEGCAVPEHMLTAEDLQIRWKEFVGEAA